MKHSGNISAENKKNDRIKNPIGRGLFIAIVVMLLVSSSIVFVLFRWHFSQSLYAQFDSRLTSVITYIENHSDADDLKRCVETGEHSEKYDEMQEFLNGMIDDLGFDYIYIVIPMETALVNVISATNAEEFAAGEDNMPLLEESDAYSPETLAKFRSYWDADDINFFEETSEWGSYYTGIKPMRDSDGQTIALICVDISSDDIHDTVSLMVSIGLSFAAAAFIVFGGLLALWLNRTVTSPLRAIEKSTSDFISTDAGTTDLIYNAPTVKAKNEVGSLARSIEKMTSDINAYINAVFDADKRARDAEEEKVRLEEKAAAAAKIAELSKSLSALLNNMPALSFYKDAETGVYVACNQAFANYANKEHPHDVVGLTDYDIFDKKTADSFVEHDRIAIEMDRPHIFLEEALDPLGNMRYFQTTKLRFTDAEGKMRLLGMCLDMTEMASARRESEKAREAYEAAMSANVTYSGIARALSTDYAYIYYVDTDSDDFIEYKTDKDNDALAVERRGKDFFEQSRHDALTLLHKDDQQAFVNAFSKENVLENIDSSGSFTYTYRMLVNGEPVYYNMKATRLTEDDHHIIIGINNVDAQMKYQEAMERLQEEHTTYSRITALSGDYIAIYTVDPQTDHYVEYSATRDYEGLGLAKEGDMFFERTYEDAAGAIYFEDLDMFRSMITKENIMKEIGEHGLFAFDYRLMITGEPFYVSLKAAMVEEKDGPQLIVGIINIDAQVKREQEYAQNLSIERSKANIDAMTGVKNKHAYIDAEASINEKIESDEKVEVALAVFDINGLKHVNDTYGHRAGDDHIRAGCEMICKTFKCSPVFRIGGDEFVAIAQGHDYENLGKLVGEIAKKNAENSAKGGVVVACGAAKYSGERNLAAVFEKADHAMYLNKRELKGE